MNLETEIKGLINKYFEQFCSQISAEHGIAKDVLLTKWKTISGSVVTNSPSQMVTTSVTSTTPTVPTTNTAVETDTKISSEQIMAANVAQLKAFCKSKKLPVGGKRQDLIDRLIKCQGDSQNTDTVSSNQTTDKAKDQPKKKKRSPNRMPSIPISSIHLKKNSHGNYEHPETKLVFDKESKQVYGKQLDDGSVAALTEHDIQQCDQFKFTYVVPETINTSTTKSANVDNSDPIVETLEEIIGSDCEEDFEEFFEDNE